LLDFLSLGGTIPLFPFQTRINREKLFYGFAIRGRRNRVINKVILIGRLGADPEIRYTPSGAEVATFRMATSENWTNKSGEKEEKTEWHRIVAWRGLAKICGEYLSKGKLVYIEGRLRTRNWEDRDGNKRNVTEIEATEMKMLGGPGEGSKKAKDSGEEYAPPAMKEEEDIPF
jgi:single-strand DNA-binding protein